MSHTKPLPSLKYLQECFELSEESPSGLVWKVRPQSHFTTSRGCATRNVRDAGSPAGSLQRDPYFRKQYFRIQISGSVYYAHRVVYSMFHNIEVPVDTQVDHKDGDGANNALDNLRLATNSENKHNVKLLKTNTSGVKGVNLHKASGMWVGGVMFKGKRYSLGYSHSLEIMADLVKELRKKLHNDFANHG